jgi:ATP-dependent 26S proteasome regulatory subunit
MPLSPKEEIEILIRARYPILYIISWEEARVEAHLGEIALRRGKKLFTWTVSRGLLESAGSGEGPRLSDSTRDPLLALDSVEQFLGPAIFLFKDFHPYLQDPTIIRRLRDLTAGLKNSYKTLILISPLLRIPPELEKDVSVCDFDLPTVEELGTLLDQIIDQVKTASGVTVALDWESREKILKAALGLTCTEAENALAKTLILDKKLNAENIRHILDEKKQIIRKSGLLEYYTAEENITDIGGLDILKDWLRKRGQAFSEKARQFGLPHPKGILLIGVQGCGKSLSAKAVSRLWGLPLLRLDMGRIFSSLVGSSEENIRRAIKVAESISPAILWIDEIEKAFAGTQSSTFSDAGTASRVFGHFITWLQEKASPVFVIATANSIEQLPPELLRKGRFDEIFFVDLPNLEERKEIFAIHLRKRGRDPARFDIGKIARAAQGFSGSEIEQAVISSLYDAFDAGKEIDTAIILRSLEETYPLSRTMKEKIDDLRKWSQGRARLASSPEAAREEGTKRKLEL